MRLGRRPFLRRVGWRSLARVGTLGLLLYSGRGCWFDLARLYISLRHRYLHHFTYCRLASNGSASPSDMSMRPLRGVSKIAPESKRRQPISSPTCRPAASKMGLGMRSPPSELPHLVSLAMISSESKCIYNIYIAKLVRPSFRRHAENNLWRCPQPR